MSTAVASNPVMPAVATPPTPASAVPAVPPPAPKPVERTYDDALRETAHQIWEVRRDACEELAAMRDRRAIPHLIRMLGDGVGAVRFCAAEALGKFGDHVAVEPLIKELSNPHFGSYAPIIESLAGIRAPEAIPHFIRLLSDSDVRVRGLAANALMVMTRQFISFKAKGPEDERKEAIRQWEHWWTMNHQAILKAGTTNPEKSAVK
jgi:HEAT repeat protein